MELSISRFIQESIDMELNISDLYQLFGVKFPGDYDFWWRLSMEEINHAALIESIDDVFTEETILPPDMIDKRIEELIKMNLFIKDRLEQYKAEAPQRQESFEIGIILENSIGEFHFELFMTEEPGTQMTEIFQKLNGEDINHAKRIENYMRDHVQ
jgi:hypothetical protein